MSSSRRERYERFRAHGLIIEAVEALLDDEGDAPGSIVLKLEHLARLALDPGVLYRHPTLRERVNRLMWSAGEYGSSPIDQLFHPPPSEPGVVRFPIALSGDGLPDGTVVRIQVGAKAMPSKPDSELSRAIEQARALAFDRYSDPKLKTASWCVLPEALGAICDGASAGLAGYVAFASFATGRAIPNEFVFTGVIEEGDAIHLPKRLPEKLVAIAKRGWITTLVSPVLEPGTPTHGKGVMPVGTLAAVHAHFEQLRKGSSEMRAIAAGTSRTEIQLAVLALLAASSQPLDSDAIDSALHMPCWPPGFCDGLELRTVLDALVERREAKTVGGAFEAGVTVSGALDAERRRKAHAALAEVTLSRRDLDPEGVRRLQHLFRARKHAEAWAELDNLLQSRSRRHVVPALRQLRDLSAPHERKALDDGVRALGASAHAEGVLVALALRCDEGPLPLQLAADGLLRAETLVDDLLWIQAVTEIALHIAAACALRDGGDGNGASERQRVDLLTRPSLGVLEDVIRAEGRHRSRDAVRRALAKAVDKLSSPWNALLHHTGAWAELAEADGALATRTADLARRTLAVLDFLPPFHDRESVLAGLVEKRGSGADASYAFFRGFYEERVRWVDFSRGRVLYADRGDVDATQVARNLELLAPLARCADVRHIEVPASQRAPSIDLLPIPVARAVAPLRTQTSLLRRLACADLAFASLLRLAAFALFDPKQGAPLRTKRALLDALLGQEHPASAILHDKSGRAATTELLLLLEWLEHAGGPLTRFSGAIDQAAMLAQQVVAMWASTEARLVAVDVEQREWPLSGIRPALPPGPATIAWRWRDGSTTPVAGAHVATHDGKRAIWLHRERAGGKETRFSVDVGASVSSFCQSR